MSLSRFLYPMWPAEENHKHHQHSHRGREGGGQTSGGGPPAATLSTKSVEVEAAVITSTSCLGMAVSQASNSAAPIRWASHPARPQEATPPDAHALIVSCSSRALSPPPAPPPNLPHGGTASTAAVICSPNRARSPFQPAAAARPRARPLARPRRPRRRRPSPTGRRFSTRRLSRRSDQR